MHFIDWISDMLWPRRCLGCQTVGHILCAACATEAVSEPRAQAHPFPRLDRLVAAGSMRESKTLERAIWTMKYTNGRILDVPLGNILADAGVKAHILPARGSVVVPVPLHPTRLRERGYNQAALLARHLGHVAALPCLEGAVERTHDTPSQVKVTGRYERLKNMEGVFSVPRPEEIAGRSIILVDDVSTTGATLSSCAGALKSAGARSVIGLVLARG